MWVETGLWPVEETQEVAPWGRLCDALNVMQYCYSRLAAFGNLSKESGIDEY